MHIILGFLGVVVTILILLKRLQDAGLDIGWLNPFSWHRRRQFRNQYHLPSAYTLDNPMDVVALFMLAIAKADGDLTLTQKEGLLSLFQNDFKLSLSASTNLLSASAHILGNGEDVTAKPSAVIARCEGKFTPEQITSTKQLLNDVANIDGPPSNAQTVLLNAFVKCLPAQSTSQW